MSNEAQVGSALRDTLTAEVERLRAERDALLNALIGVVAVADRKTDEFDAARAAIDAAQKEPK